MHGGDRASLLKLYRHRVSGFSFALSEMPHACHSPQTGTGPVRSHARSPPVAATGPMIALSIISKMVQ